MQRSSEGGGVVNDRYYLPEYGETEEDARESPVDMNKVNGFAVEACAQDFFRNESGWEAEWPITFIFLRDGEPPTKWIVECRMEPDFYAHQKEEAHHG
jgi:hypothetical protein